MALNIVYLLVEKKQHIFIPELYHNPKNWHLYLSTSQVSWINKDKSELLIVLILVNNNSIHPDAYPRNVGIILDTSIFLTHDIIFLTTIHWSYLFYFSKGQGLLQ